MRRPEFLFCFCSKYDRFSNNVKVHASMLPFQLAKTQNGSGLETVVSFPCRQPEVMAMTFLTTLIDVWMQEDCCGIHRIHPRYPSSTKCLTRDKPITTWELNVMNISPDLFTSTTPSVLDCHSTLVK